MNPNAKYREYFNKDLDRQADSSIPLTCFLPVRGINMVDVESIIVVYPFTCTYEHVQVHFQDSFSRICVCAKISALLQVLH